MPRLLAALVALALLIAPAAADAATKHRQTNAPPGNSAIDQYLETVPDASGSAAPRPPSAGGGSSSGALTAAQRAKLERLGADGTTLAAAVDATSPRHASKPGSRDQIASALEGRSPRTQILDAAVGDDSGGGMGLVLPGILLASLLAIVTLVVIRRRSSS